MKFESAKPNQGGRMKYSIQANIPIPPKKDGRPKDPDSFSGKLRALKVGQSVLHPTWERSMVGATAQRVLGAGNYALRKVEGGYRVWKIK